MKSFHLIVKYFNFNNQELALRRISIRTNYSREVFSIMYGCLKGGLEDSESYCNAKVYKDNKVIMSLTNKRGTIQLGSFTF